jgi:MscS family membrane protein
LEFSFEKISIALAIFFVFLFLRKLFTLFIIKTAEVFVKNTKTGFDDALLEILVEPIRFSFIVLGYYLASTFLEFDNVVNNNIIVTSYVFIVFWIMFVSIEKLDNPIKNFSKRFGQELYQEIGTFIVKGLRLFIFILGFVAILQVWGINVSAFLASLGLGGLAFALAAKDTAANLFGGLTILADKSLKLDDWIKVGDVEGVVEDIGLRTTKIRTFEKSLITLPNQILANKPVENFSKRGIRRIKCRIGLTYSTPKHTIVKIVEDIKILLQSHSKIAQNETMLVRFDEFEASSLSVFVYTFTNTANWNEYLEIREDINLKIIDIVEKNESSFAFPTQSIFIEKE